MLSTKMIAMGYLVSTIRELGTHVAPEDLFCVIDIGSNNVKAGLYDGQGRELTIDFNKTIGLGEEESVLSPEKVELTMRVIADWFDQLEQLQVPSDHISVVATAAVRYAEEHGDHLFRSRYADTALTYGWPSGLRVLSHEQEAFYGLSGALSSLGPLVHDSIVVEIGGKSLQFTFIADAERFRETGRPDAMLLFQPYGVRYLGKQVPSLQNGLDAGMRYIEERFRNMPQFQCMVNDARLTGKDLLFTGGSYWKIRSVLLADKHKGLPLTLTEEDLLRSRDILSSMSYEELKDLSAPEFDDPVKFVIPMITAKVLIETLQPRSVQIATGALRNGIVAEMVRQQRTAFSPRT